MSVRCFEFDLHEFENFIGQDRRHGEFGGPANDDARRDLAGMDAARPAQRGCACFGSDRAINRDLDVPELDTRQPTADFAERGAPRYRRIIFIGEPLGDFAADLPDTRRRCGDGEAGLAADHAVAEQRRQFAAQEHHAERSALHDFRLDPDSDQEIRISCAGGEYHGARLQQ